MSADLDASFLGPSPCSSPTGASASAAAASAVPQENIKACVRMRPFDKRELAAGEECAWIIDNEAHTLTRRVVPRATKALTGIGAHRDRDPGQNCFPCSTLFDERASTAQLYDGQVRDIVESAMRGVNGSVLVYGQTSSGKTHSMKGNRECLGLIPLAMRHVFAHIRSCRDHEFLLRMSYIEIYNEHVKDLLQKSGTDLAIHESKSRGVHVQSFEAIVRSEEEVVALMEKGEAQRHYGRTEMNDFSSRSHTILRLMIESNPTGATAAAVEEENVANAFSPRNLATKLNGKKNKAKVKVSVLNFVDLAGSERLSQTKARVGSKTQLEGSAINQSLMFLGVIISRLSEGDKLAHLPFRDSKLTRILQSSLGGNARTSIICTVSPALSNMEQTVSTLRFGMRAIKVQNHAKVNEIALENALINKQKQSIAALQEQIEDISASVAELENEDEARNRNAALIEAQRLADAAQVVALQAQLANLESFIHRPQSFGGSSSAASAADNPKTPARRRHTFGATPARLRPHGSPDCSPVRGLGLECLSELSDPSSGSGSGDFRAEQVAVAQARIATFETLLSELSAENEELTAYQDEILARCEVLAADVETMQAKLAPMESAAALADLDADGLDAIEAQMAAAIARVQREKLYREFKRMHGLDRTEPIQQRVIETQTDAEPADPIVEQLKQQLEETRLSKESVQSDLASVTAAAEARERALTSEAEKWAVAAEAETARHTAAAAAQAAQVASLQETCATLSAQTHKYAKEIMQLRGGGTTGGSDSARSTMVPAIPVAAAATAPIVAPISLMAAAQHMSAPIVPVASPVIVAAPIVPAIPVAAAAPVVPAPRALGELHLGQLPLQPSPSSSVSALSTKDLFASLNPPDVSVKRAPSRLTSLIASGRKAPQQL